MPSPIRYTLVALVTVALALLLGEATCRVAGYRSLEQYVPDPEVGWLLAPRQTTVTNVGRFPVTVNADGFRDDPLAPRKPPRTVRIFALGASTTFGWGVPQDAPYHQVLERLLNQHAARAGGVRYEIINAGVIGYNQWQTATLLRRLTARYAPDGFIVAYTFNDAWNQYGTLDAAGRARVLAGVRRKNVLRSSALYNWLTGLRAAAAGRVAENAVEPDALARRQTGDGPAPPAALAAYSATLHSLTAFPRAPQLSLVLVVLAGRGQRAPWPRQALMSAAGVAAGAPVVDVVAAFADATPDSLFLPGDGVHPSPHGHAVIGRLLYGTLCAAAHAAPPGDRLALYRDGCDPGKRSGVLRTRRSTPDLPADAPEL